jgi:hypothetical protein
MTLDETMASRFLPELSMLWIVADPDALLLGEGLGGLLRARNMALAVYEDPMRFRQQYELHWRPALQSGALAALIVSFCPDQDGFDRLPADVLAEGRRMELSAADYFPKLNRSLVASLSSSSRSALWLNQDMISDFLPTMEASADTVLRLVYQIDPAVMRNEAAHLRQVLAMHRRGLRLEECLVTRLESIWRSLFNRPPWPLRELLRSPGALWDFLQGEWRTFLSRQGVTIPQQKGATVAENAQASSVPFADPDVQPIILALFREGLLQPERVIDLPATSERAWWVAGIRCGNDASSLSESEWAERQREVLAAIPAATDGHERWQSFAERYARFGFQIFGEYAVASRQESFWREVWPVVHDAFSRWFSARFDDLLRLPPNPPVVLHHIAPWLRRRVSEGKRVALIVCDGMSWAQWNGIRGTLQRHHPAWRYQEHGCFTFVPSLTPVCRQALYSGEPPYTFAATLDQTSQDRRRWEQYWEGTAGLPRDQAIQHRVDGNPSDMAAVDLLASRSRRVVGLTINKLDDMMHGMEMGWTGLNQQTRLWTEQGFLARTIERFHSAGFDVFITSDHGHIEALGGGRIQEGALVDRKGERARLYHHAGLRSSALASLTGKGYAWNSCSLPENYYPLLSSGRNAFANQGDSLVCHGGISLDECIVPLVEVLNCP